MASLTRSAICIVGSANKTLSLASKFPIIAGPSNVTNSCRKARRARAPLLRNFVTTTQLYRAPIPPPTSKSSPPTEYRDSAIPFRHVQLVDPITKSLQPSTSLASLLKTYDHETHSLILVTSEPTPIVKLISKEEERIKLRESEAKEKLRRKAAAEEKEVQVSWSSADGDIHHKIEIAKSILEKGDRIQLVFAPRSGAKIGSERKEELVNWFNGILSEVGTKWREDEVTKTTVVEFWQAKEGVRVERRQKLTEKEMDKKREKEEKKEARRRKEEERKRKAGVVE